MSFCIVASAWSVSEMNKVNTVTSGLFVFFIFIPVAHTEMIILFYFINAASLVEKGTFVLRYSGNNDIHEAS